MAGVYVGGIAGAVQDLQKRSKSSLKLLERMVVEGMVEDILTDFKKEMKRK